MPPVSTPGVSPITTADMTVEAMGARALTTATRVAAAASLGPAATNLGSRRRYAERRFKRKLWLLGEGTSCLRAAGQERMRTDAVGSGGVHAARPGATGSG